MTVMPLQPPTGWFARPAREGAVEEEVAPRRFVPPLDPRLQLLRATLVLVAVFCACFALELVLVSSLQQASAQRRAFDAFRGELANGTAPLAAGELQDKQGKPVAYLEIPSIGLRQVVLEGTSGGQLFDGPGHRRDTPLPGQVGTSVVMGRRAAFGGPFAKIDGLRPNATIRVTTGAGKFDYRVLTVRRAGDDAPPSPRSGASRLVLATADGTPFVPSGLLLVDAQSLTPGLGGARPLFSATTLPNAERMMAPDTTTIWRLVLWLQVLLVVVIASVWAWHEWHRAKTWIVFVPAFLFVGLMTASEAARFLPNLL